MLLRSVIVTGMKHTGKTTLAHLLARWFRLPFYDLDDEIEVEYRPDRALSCREIYAHHGPQYFQELERSAARRVSAELAATTSVAAAGGGIADNRDALALMADAGVVTYLTEHREILFERIMAHGRPAFLSAETPQEDFETIFRRRDPVYRRFADIVVDLHGLDINRSLARMLSALTEEGYAR